MSVCVYVRDHIRVSLDRNMHGDRLVSGPSGSLVWPGSGLAPSGPSLSLAYLFSVQALATEKHLHQ